MVTVNASARQRVNASARQKSSRVSLTRQRVKGGYTERAKITRQRVDLNLFCVLLHCIFYPILIDIITKQFTVKAQQTLLKEGGEGGEGGEENFSSSRYS